MSSVRSYSTSNPQKKTCYKKCTYTSSTTCPEGYSTDITSCASGKYFASTSCTTIYSASSGSPSGCAKPNTTTTGGTCNTCTYYEDSYTSACPAGYEYGITSCESGYTLEQASIIKTSVMVREHGTESECPTYTSTTTFDSKDCGKCVGNKYYIGLWSNSHDTCPRVAACVSVNGGTRVCQNPNDLQPALVYATTGDRVEITTKVDSDRYGVSSLIRGYDVSGTTYSGTSHTFTMPSHDVSVSPVYINDKKCPSSSGGEDPLYFEVTGCKVEDAGTVAHLAPDYLFNPLDFKVANLTIIGSVPVSSVGGMVKVKLSLNHQCETPIESNGLTGDLCSLHENDLYGDNTTWNAFNEKEVTIRATDIFEDNRYHLYFPISRTLTKCSAWIDCTYQKDGITCK